MKKFLKGQKGVTGVDAVLAVAIAVLFAGIIVTLSYNIYITTNSLKRSSQALSYITSTFEYVATQYYDEVTKDNIEKYINGNEEEDITALDEGKLSTGSTTPYKAEVTVTKYNETDGNTYKLDLVKEIKMTVTYKLGNKGQKVEMTTAKSREKLEIPNKPDLDLLVVQEGKNKYSIKYQNGIWKVTNVNDASWYNYNNGIWGTILVTEEQKIVGDVVKKEDGTIYLWIPRFAYSTTDTTSIEFLYKNTNNQIIDNEGTTKIETTQLTTPTIFSEKNGVWITKENLTEEPYTYFQNKYALDTAKYDGKLWESQ